MTTTWFFDAAGTGRDCRVLVLSGVGGSDAMWNDLNLAWRAALNEAQLPEWHSSAYFRRKGDTERRQMPAALLNVIGKQVSSEFNCVSYAVDRIASETLREQHPELVPSDSQMLMRLCFNGLGAAKADQDQLNCIRILFDRNEPFINHLKRSWQDGRKYLLREGAEGWPLQVRSIESASSKDHPGLQVADLLSWSIRCRYEYGDKMVDPKIPKILFPFFLKLRGGFLNSDNVRALYVDRSSPSLSHHYSFV